jgi:transcriptional antiterminator Rof (Rho-off)
MKKYVVAAILLLICITSIIVYFKRTKNENLRIKLTLPNGEVVEATRAKPMSEKVKKEILSVSLDGKIEEISVGNDEQTRMTRIVMITNNGEMLMLLNPDLVNALKFRNHIGKIVHIDGYWYGNIPFNKKEYRAVWINAIGNKK